MNTNTLLRGTAAELAGHIALNGKMLEQPDISFLTRLGVAKKIGTQKKDVEGRGGKPANIWEFPSKLNLRVEPVEPANDPPAKTGRAGMLAPITHEDLQEVIVRAVAEAVSQIEAKSANAAVTTAVTTA